MDSARLRTESGTPVRALAFLLQGQTQLKPNKVFLVQFLVVKSATAKEEHESDGDGENDEGHRQHNHELRSDGLVAKEDGVQHLRSDKSTN